ncbi:MAG: FtsX-like permease family protein [Nocardioides sp.]
MIGPTGRQPVLTGTRVGLTVTRDLDADGPVYVGMTLHVTGRTEQIRAMFGPLESGEHTMTVKVPECRRGCTWEELAVGGPATLPTQLAGTVSVGGLTVDGTPLAEAMTEASWAEADTMTARLVRSQVAGGLLRLAIDTEGEEATVRFLSGSTPVFRPVVLGENAGDNLRPVEGGEGYPLWVDRVPVRPVLTSRSVPFLGPEGIAVDATLFTSGRHLYDELFTPYVLARGDTPPAVRRALTQEGLTQLTSRAREQRILGRSAYALALRLYLVVAAVVVAIALVGLLVTTAVQMPSRRRDAAALRVVGVSRRAVVTAVVWEVLVVLGAAAVAGIVAGTVAQDIVLRTVTLGYAEAISTPRPVTAVDSLWLALVSVATAAVLGVVAAGSAALTVRGARGATLRESAR